MKLFVFALLTISALAAKGTWEEAVVNDTVDETVKCTTGLEMRCIQHIVRGDSKMTIETRRQKETIRDSDNNDKIVYPVGIFVTINGNAVIHQVEGGEVDEWQSRVSRGIDTSYVTSEHYQAFAQGFLDHSDSWEDKEAEMIVTLLKVSSKQMPSTMEAQTDTVSTSGRRRKALHSWSQCNSATYFRGTYNVYWKPVWPSLGIAKHGALQMNRICKKSNTKYLFYNKNECGYGCCPLQSCMSGCKCGRFTPCNKTEGYLLIAGMCRKEYGLNWGWTCNDQAGNCMRIQQSNHDGCSMDEGTDTGWSPDCDTTSSAWSSTYKNVKLFRAKTYQDYDWGAEEIYLLIQHSGPMNCGGGKDSWAFQYVNLPSINDEGGWYTFNIWVNHMSHKGEQWKIRMWEEDPTWDTYVGGGTLNRGAFGPNKWLKTGGGAVQVNCGNCGQLNNNPTNGCPNWDNNGSYYYATQHLRWTDDCKTLNCTGWSNWTRGYIHGYFKKTTDDEAASGNWWQSAGR